MRKTNYHMHTKRCMHASGSDEDYVLAAIEGGYEEIGFSDHSPWQYRVTMWHICECVQVSLMIIITALKNCK